MRRDRARSAVAVLSLLAWANGVIVPSPRGQRTVTEDRNHDGRPDVWLSYGPDDELARVAIDTNFDGRLDQEEEFASGALVRRSIDRDFDDRADLVEEFDPVTHSARTILDEDFDGSADLLILSRGGEAVFRKWADASAPVSAAAAQRDGDPRDPTLAAIGDPFRADTVIRTLARADDDTASARLTPKSVRLVAGAASAPIDRRRAPHALRDERPSSIRVTPSHTRAPPAASL